MDTPKSPTSCPSRRVAALLVLLAGVAGTAGGALAAAPSPGAANPRPSRADALHDQLRAVFAASDESLTGLTEGARFPVAAEATCSTV